MRRCLAQARLLPEGQRLAQEPTRMDPVLGVTVYLEPDFEALTKVRSFAVPRQLRNPHPAVAAFQAKKALVSKSQTGRAARFLQALVHAATEVGWKVPEKVPNMSRGRGESGPDLTLRLPSRELVVVIRELDQRGRRAQPFVTEWDYYTRKERTVSNKHFQATGNLEVMVTRAWEDQTVLSLRDTGGATLEDQLPVLIHKLKIAEAEADWSRREESRRSEIRKVRWEEVKQEAFTKLTYERNAEQLRKQLERRRAAAEMRAYADEVTACSALREGTESEDAFRWAEWIRQHADQTDPINGPLRLLRATSATHDELAPHMNGWNTYGPYLR